MLKELILESQESFLSIIYYGMFKGLFPSLIPLFIGEIDAFINNIKKLYIFYENSILVYFFAKEYLVY